MSTRLGVSPDKESNLLLVHVSVVSGTICHYWEWGNLFESLFFEKAELIAYNNKVMVLGWGEG